MVKIEVTATIVVVRVVLLLPRTCGEEKGEGVE